MFLRLWRKLEHVCGARYNFVELTDICNFFQLFIGTNVNPDFIRSIGCVPDAARLLLPETNQRLGAGRSDGR